MFLKRVCYLFFFLFVLSTELEAQQETIITGKVTEISTNRGIPFVNIFFKGTIVGTSTDFEGNYAIKTTKPKDSIYISQLGYQSKAKAVKKGQVQIINFQLSTEALNLSTIEIHPGINPALRIIKNAMDNKEKYNRDNLESVQFISYTKQEADVDNITDRMRKRKIFRQITAMWDAAEAPPDLHEGEENETHPNPPPSFVGINPIAIGSGRENQRTSQTEEDMSDGTPPLREAGRGFFYPWQ